nr:MAG TPA: hypothetical protein [Caudoviricetes sp.]
MVSPPPSCGQERRIYPLWGILRVVCRLSAGLSGGREQRPPLFCALCPACVPRGGCDPSARILGWLLPAAYMAAPYAVRGGY